MNMIYQPLEWEYLVESLKITGNTSSTINTSTITEFRVSRSKDYKLNCEIYGQSNSTSIFEEQKGESGEMIELINFSCDSVGLKYELNGCFFRNKNFDYNFQNDNYNYTCRLHINEVIGYTPNNDATILVEWYINGPKDDLIFTRLTERSKKSIYSRTRENEESEILERDNGSYSDRDYIIINYYNKSFIVKKVPDKFSPHFSSKIAIEYREDLGGIPSEEERRAISEIISFIFGKKLINIGYTKYNPMYYITEFSAINPSEANIVELCKQGDRSPININHYRGGNNVEEVLSVLVPKYLELKDKLHLDYALWNYWIAQELPIGSNIPIMASGVETISNSWFKSNKKVKSVYMKKEEYNKIVNEAIEIVSKKLDGNKYKQRILNKMSNCYQMSGNERINLFYDTIGLKIGKVEQEAIKARNTMIHGASVHNQKKFLKAIQDTNAYFTFFNKIILILLGYNGKYIDYSVAGWPEKDIDTLLGKEC